MSKCSGVPEGLKQCAYDRAASTLAAQYTLTEGTGLTGTQSALARVGTAGTEEVHMGNGGGCSGNYGDRQTEWKVW